MAWFQELKDELRYSTQTIERIINPSFISEEKKGEKNPYPDDILKKSLTLLEKSGRLNSESLVAENQPVKFWGFSFPKKTCGECVLFTTDRRCALWIAIVREDRLLVKKYLPPYMHVRMEESFSSKAHACFKFHEKPKNFRRKTMKTSTFLKKMDLHLTPPEPILLSASLFSKVRFDPSTSRHHFCHAAAALTMLGYDHYNTVEFINPEERQEVLKKYKMKPSSISFIHDARKGLELHHLFQRVNERMVRWFHKKERKISKESVLLRLETLKTAFYWMTFQHLTVMEVNAFLERMILYFKRKLITSPLHAFKPLQVLECVYGGVPKAEEQITGTTLKGRADVVVHAKDGIMIMDLKSSYHDYQKLQLTALGMAMEEQKGKQGVVKRLIILTPAMKPEDLEKGMIEYEFTIDEYRNEINKLKKELKELDASSILTRNSCLDYLCEKRAVCTKQNLQEFKVGTTTGYECYFCGSRFEQLECRTGFPSHAFLQCRTCRSTYKHFVKVHSTSGKKISMITAIPDCDHVLVKNAAELGVQLPEPRIYPRRDVKIIYPETDFNESLLKEGMFPVMDEGGYPSLLHVALIIDKKGCLSKEIMKFLETTYDIKVIQDPETFTPTKVHPFYNHAISVIRESEGFLQQLTVTNILSRFTFSQLAINLLDVKSEEGFIQNWTILDVYLHALTMIDPKPLLAMEASAGNVMFNVLKPYLKRKQLGINSRMLQRRVNDQYLFSAKFIETAARSKGNVLLNFYFKKCGEFVRLLHNKFLLGWFGSLGLHHGRLRKSALDIIGLVVDLNENFKLAFLLGLLVAIKEERIFEGDVKAWIGRRRMYDYYIGREQIDEMNERCKHVWINGELKQFQLEITRLEEEYEKFVQEFKRQVILLYVNLTCNTVDGFSYLHHLMNGDGTDDYLKRYIKLESMAHASSWFHPFTLVSRKISLPNEEKMLFFQRWMELIRPLDERCHDFIDQVLNECYFLFITKKFQLEEPLDYRIKTIITAELDKSEFKFISRSKEVGFLSSLVTTIVEKVRNNKVYQDPRLVKIILRYHLKKYYHYIAFPFDDLKQKIEKRINKLYEKEFIKDKEFYSNFIKKEIDTSLKELRLSFDRVDLKKQFNIESFLKLYPIQQGESNFNQVHIKQIIESIVDQSKGILKFNPI
ncbi:MAG: PD-(D/E)XK nuclease family protein [Promethearchaeota archaeon]